MRMEKLFGVLIVAAIVIAAIVFGHSSGYARMALNAIHATHGLWLIGKIAIVVVTAGGLLAARVYKALRPAQDTASGR